MQIELELRNHCIQTAAKQAYERLLVRCLKGDLKEDESRQLEKQIECLVFLMTHADFNFLRSSYPDLDGHRHHRIRLNIPENVSDMTIQWDDQSVFPRWKQKN
jgi:hypothetical protein